MKEKLLRALLDVSLGNVEGMLPKLLHSIYEVTPCKKCSLWKINYQEKFLSIQAAEGYHSTFQNRSKCILHINDDNLLGYYTANLLKDKKADKTTTCFDISSTEVMEYWKKIKHKECAKKPDLDRMIVIAIPTLPTSNSEQVRTETILAIYPKNDSDFKSGCPEIIRDYFSLALSRLNLTRHEQLVQDIKHVYEKRATKDLASILYPIVNKELKKYFNYEGCSVFQWDSLLNRLALVQTTGIDKPARKNEIFYYLDEGLTGFIAKDKKQLIIDDLDEERPKDCLEHKWQEKIKNSAKTFAGIPIMSPSRSNELLGVIRFTNKLNPLVPSIVDYFNKQDIALIQHACSLIALYMEAEQNERIHITVTKKMAHEMMTPAVAIRGTTRRLSRKWKDPLFLSQGQVDSYLSSISDHIELQIALTRNIELTKRIGISRQNHYQIGKYDLQKDIIEHSKNLVIPTVANLKLFFDKIHIESPFPQLFIDKFAFQQVFFNMLTNAIKYRDLKAPNEFKIVIKNYGLKIYEIPNNAQGYTENIGKKQSGFLFSIEDHGMGIESKQKDKIFQMGYRIHGIEKREVRGLGMGLTIVGEILKDFYCNIWLTNFGNPTRFDIFLPEKLQSGDYIETDEWKAE